MNTVTITTNEYKRLLFSTAKRPTRKQGEFIAAAFGILKKTFGKTNSAAIVNKMRKSWRA